MVVNGGVFHSLVIPYTNHVDVIDCPKMAGKAVLMCRPNSHPFVDRTLSLEHPVKIGRSVARARAAQTNGVFDCKVLSRNHALIWYNNGKFYLQDTKSSNGTFVNNQRLSKSGEESLPREVSSGDIVQFGVDVLENARKVTHGCIVANLKLYLPDGKEAKASPSTGVVSGVGNVFIEDLYQLNQYIQEALQREQMLQSKLASLQQLVMSMKKAADLGWKALIAEDRLLSRVEILENQLQTYGKNVAEDKLREELRLLQEDKGVYQGLAKECLQKVLQEKLEAVQKCQTIERALLSAEMECANYKVVVEQDHEELTELALKHTNQILKTVELQNKLQESEELHKEALARLELENEVLNNEVKRLLKSEVLLHEKIQRLEASGEMVGRQLIGFQTQLHNKCSLDTQDHLSSLKERNGSSADVICKNNEEEMNEENQKEVTNAMDSLLNMLIASVEEQKQTQEVYELIEAQASLLKADKHAKLDQIKSIEAELGLHVDKLCKYKEENVTLQKSLRSLEETMVEDMLNNEDTVAEDSVIDTIIQNDGNDDKPRKGKQPSPTLQSIQLQITELKEAINESQSRMEAVEQTIGVLEVDLNSAKKGLAETIKNCAVQDEKLEEAQKLKEESETSVIVLKEQMKTIEDSINDLTAQEKFETESENINKHKEEETILRKQLQEAQLSAKQHKNEAELLKEKLCAAVEELEQAKLAAEKRLPNNEAEDELAKSKMQVNWLKAHILTLDAQVKSMQTAALSKNHEQEAEEENNTQTEIPQDALDETVNKLRLRVYELDEDLVLVKQKYMECNDKKTQLEKELSSLKEEYEAVIHQPYFNLIFVLPLFLLILTITLAVHPTLAHWLGTSDPALPDLDS